MMKNFLFANPRILALIILKLTMGNAMAIDSTSDQTVVKLLGHVPKKAIANAVEIDSVDPDTALAVTFVLPLRDQQALEELIAKMYDSNNHDYYRKYLTPEEFADRFSPTQEDYDTVIAYAKEAGLDILETHPNRLLLSVTGPTKALEAAFQIKLNLYQQENGTTFYASTEDPSIQATIAPRVQAILGLETANTQEPYAIRRDPAGDRMLSANAPKFPSGPLEGFSPSDIKRAYNLTGVSATGLGQKVAIFAPGSYLASEINTYASYFGMPTPRLFNVLIGNGASGYSVETALDIQLVFAMAPNSEIYVYQCANNSTAILAAYNKIATDNIAKQVSSSWGWAESYAGPSIMKAENNIFMQMAAQGQTVFVASGDSGAYQNGPTQPLAIQDPGSQPYVTAVGGTTLNIHPITGAYVSETVWSGSGGGVSSLWTIPVWQQNTPNISSVTYRNTPDVALNSDPYTGYSIYTNGGWGVFGGTSCAAPLWAGFAALVNEQRAASQLPVLGFANPTFYNLGRLLSAQAAGYRDITVGNNLFYSGIVGYDNATGWGSFNGARLLTALSNVIAVNLTSPTNNATVAGNVSLNATATDSVGINRVEFYLNSTLIGQDLNAPYAAALNTTTFTDGTYTLKAVAYDILGASAQKTTNLTIYNGIPQVSIVTPTHDSLVARSVNILASATDRMDISRVDLFLDSQLIQSNRIAPYSAVLDTTTLSDGPHLISAMAYNTLGTSSQATAPIRVYNGAPQVSVVTPTSDALVARTVEIAAQATDAIDISRVDLYVDSTLLSTDTTSPYSIPLDTTTITDGPHILKAVAYNALGTPREATASVRVYNGAPQVSVVTPAPDALVARTVEITAQATDAIDISRVDLYVDSTLLSSDTTSPYSMPLDTTTIADGPHILKAVAYNALGTPREATASMQVYNGTPLVNVITPPMNNLLGGQINIEASATDSIDITKVDLYIDSTLLSSDKAAPYATPLNTNYVADGAHIIKAIAYNALGSTSQALLPMNVYNGKPKVTISNPAKDAAIAGIINVTVGATDVLPISLVELYADGVLMSQDTTAPYSLALNSTSLPDGPHTLKAVAYNTAGNFNESSMNVTVYNSKPKVTLVSPLNNATVGGTITTEALVTDIKNITRVDFYVDSKLVFSDTTPPYSVTFNTLTVPNGAHVFRAVAYNNLGTSGEATANIKVSNTPPAIKLITPVTSESLSGTVPISVTVTDPVGVERVSFYVDSTLITSDTVAPYTATLNTNTLSDGLHTIKVVGKNNAGGSNTLIVNVNVANAAPKVAFATPGNGEVVTGIIPVTVNASSMNGTNTQPSTPGGAVDPNAIMRVELYVDSKLIETDSAMPYSILLNTALLTKGAHTLKAVGYNYAGKTGTAMLNITVN